MSRRPNKHARPFTELRSASTGGQRIEDGWVVRTITGAAAEKSYLCPGCHRTIAPGVAHVVAWPREPGLAGAATVADRRHWHTGCWRSGVGR